MKKTLLVALALLGVGVASSKADVAFSVSFGNHYRAPVCAPVYAPPVCATPVVPVVVAPAPVYQPVYAQPVYAPVYRPAPVVVQPVVVQPSYSYGYSYPRHYGYSYSSPGYCAPAPRRSVHVRW